MKPLKIRCSKIGEIMTGTIGLTEKQAEKLDKYYKRTKPLTDNMKAEVAELEHKRDNPKLPKTVLNYLAELEIQERTGRKKQILTKQMEKGIAAEEEAITLLSGVTGKFYMKNEEQLENDYLTGTPDIISDIVRDIKCSWSIFTFPHPWNYELDQNYYWQLQGYMALTGLQEASLDYCLVDAPDHIIEAEKNRLFRDTAIVINEDSGEFSWAIDEVYKLMTYKDLPDESRVYSIPVKRDDAAIQRIYERIEICRDFWAEKIGEVKAA